MSKDDSQHDILQSLIVQILDAEAQGELVDREELLRNHPQHEASLKEFFSNHDSMKAVGDQEEATLPPTASAADELTLPPSQTPIEDITLPPTATARSETQVGDKIRYFGDYELVEEIARGGMGVVYKARQVNLNRIVALKMILSGQLASEEDVQRFYTEAEAAANLDHPGIVPIFEIGEHQGQHYFSMGYIEGQSLADKVADGPLPPREAAELVQKICEAMAYAHERGVIHRDLKPANILLDQNGQPRVTDFGLAKRMEADSNLTGTGQILGTPSYMAPEQAGGKVEEVGARADVYALGGILYCLLAGRPPFQAANPMDTLLQVLDKEPLSPRQLNASLPIDLETITLKCLEKEPSKRYPKSLSLQNELERFLADRPIVARPIGRLERSWRWCRRNPAIASLSIASACALIAGSVFSSYFAIRANKNAKQSQANEKYATEEGQRADNEATRAKAQMEVAQQEERRAQNLLYSKQLNTAFEAVEQANSRGAWNALDETKKELRGWEFSYIDYLVSAGRKQLRVPNLVTATFTSDGGSLVIGKRDGKLEVRDPDSGATLREAQVGKFAIESIRCSVGEISAFDVEGVLSTWDEETLKPRNRLELGIGTRKPSFPFALIGGREHFSTGVATPVGGVLQLDLRNSKSGGLLKNLFTAEPPRMPNTMAVSSLSGNRVACCRLLAPSVQESAPRQHIEVWNTEDGNRVQDIEFSDGILSAIALSPLGSQLAAISSTHQQIYVWDMENGQQSELPFSLQGANRLLYSPNSDHFAVATNDCTIHYVSAEDGSLVRSWTGHKIGVSELQFDNTGRQLLSIGQDNTIFVADLESEAVHPPIELASRNKYKTGLPRSPEPISELSAVSPDGSLAAVINHSNQELEVLPLLPSIKSLTLECAAVACSFSRDGNLLAVAADDNAITVFDARNGDIAVQFETGFPASKDEDRPRPSLSLSRDGSRLAVGGTDGSVGIWSLADGRKLTTLPKQKGRVHSLEFTNSDEHILCKAFAAGSCVLMWNTNTAEEVWRSKETGAQYGNLAVTSAGNLFAHDGVDYSDRKNPGKQRIWIRESATGTLLLTIYANVSAVHSLCFDGTDERIVANCWTDNSSTINLWDLQTGVEVASFEAPYQTFDVSRTSRFTIEDNVLLTTGLVGTSVWDARWAIHLWGSGPQSVAANRPMASSSVADSVSENTDENLLAEPSNNPTIPAVSKDISLTDGSVESTPEQGSASTKSRPIVATAAPKDPSIKLRFSSGHAFGLSDLAYSPDGKLIASAGNDGDQGGKIRIHDVSDGIQVRFLSGHTKGVSAIDFSPDGEHIASSGMDGTVKVWNVNDGELLLDLKGSNNFEYDIAYSPDGAWIASAGWDKLIRIWNANTGILDRTLEGHTASVSSVAFNSDGKALVSTGFLDRTARIWNVDESEQRSTFNAHSGVALDAQFVPSRPELIVSVGGDIGMPGQVRVWNAQGNMQASAEGHTTRVVTLEFNPSGKLLATGGFDDIVRLWETSSWSQVHVFSGHPSNITALTFSPDGKHLASASGDLVTVWQLPEH